MRYLFLGLMLCFASVSQTYAERQYIILLATTSVENSGFLDYILPHFKADTGVEVRAVIAGSGAAILSGRRGNGDVLLTHSLKDELAFVESGYGVERLPLMYNEFVVIGAAADKANITTADSVQEAFARIKDRQAKFISRSDNSGTDRREKSIWQEIGFDAEATKPEWYLQSGSGMSAAFNIATTTGAYIFGDTSSWAKFGNKQNHKILFKDSENLKNQYSLIAVNPERHPHVKADDVQIFINWLLSDKGQGLIGDYKVDGLTLFTANADSK